MTGGARKPCNQAGCPNLQPCAAHTPKAWSGSTRSARLPSSWPKLRRFVLRRDNGVCQLCRSAPATEVDHIVAGDNHHVTNLQAVCSPCHRDKTLREARAARDTRSTTT